MADKQNRTHSWSDISAATISFNNERYVCDLVNDIYSPTGTCSTFATPAASTNTTIEWNPSSCSASR